MALLYSLAKKVEKVFDTPKKIADYRTMFTELYRPTAIVINARLHWKRAGRSFVYLSLQ
jgi:hypothetical protein